MAVDSEEEVVDGQVEVGFPVSSDLALEPLLRLLADAFIEVSPLDGDSSMQSTRVRASLLGFGNGSGSASALQTTERWTDWVNEFTSASKIAANKTLLTKLCPGHVQMNRRCLKKRGRRTGYIFRMSPKAKGAHCGA